MKVGPQVHFSAQSQTDQKKQVGDQLIFFFQNVRRLFFSPKLERYAGLFLFFQKEHRLEKVRQLPFKLPYGRAF